MTKITRILSIIILLCVSLWGGAGSVASAEEYIPSAQDRALLTMINQARQNPLAAAAALGLNSERILKDLPALQKILLEGLPPLTFNANLAAAARAHTRDMLAQGYYAHKSPDGRGYDARIRASGYPLGATGESLGMLFFDNFINPTDAARVIFQYMFWDELDPSRTEKRNILDPDLREAGVSVDTGVFNLGGASRNVYEATVDFGAAISGPETALLQLINQARANPLGVAQSLGIDMAPYLAAHPEFRAAFEQGLSPLTINASLFSASQAHARDMMEKNYYGKTSPAGRTYEQRIRDRGYHFAAAGELLGITWVFAAPSDPLVAVNRIFQRMLREELNPARAGDLTILNPWMQEAGVALRNGVFISGQSEAYLAVCDVGLPAPPAPIEGGQPAPSLP